MQSTYIPIATTTLGSAQASYTFSSIPTTYTDLVLIGNGYGTISNGQAPTLIFNSDTSALYSRTVLSGNGTAASSTRDSGGNSIIVGNAVGWETDSTKPAMFIAHIMNYSNTTTFKTILARDGAANTTYPGTEANVGLYRSTNAINSIQIKAGGTANFATGSTFTLYGIKAA